jgi:hypothetical protein
MSDLFGAILELLFGNRWIRYAVGALVYVGTVWNGDFSTAQPWIVLGVNTLWLAGFELADRFRKR